MGQAVGRACKVRGAAHEFEWPNLVLTMYILPLRDDGFMYIRCTSMSGEELVSLQTDPEKSVLSDLRTDIAGFLRFPKRKIQLALPDGRLLSEADDGLHIGHLEERAGRAGV